MKKISLLMLILGISINYVAAQEEYLSVMKEKISEIETYKTPEQFNDAAKVFERIATTEETRWQPYYYAAYCKIIAAFTQKQKADAYCDEAMKYIEEAELLEPDISEIECLKAMYNSAKMMVNPMQRYQEYGVAYDKALKRAEKNNKENPRIFLLRGQNLLYTPEAYGGGKEAANVEFQKARKLFETFKLTSPENPNWGLNLLNNLQEQK